jgi:hypothetical protein
VGAMYPLKNLAASLINLQNIKVKHADQKLASSKQFHKDDPLKSPAAIGKDWEQPIIK